MAEGGKEDLGRMKSWMEEILPVVVEIIIVAGVNRPAITALEEARMMGWEAS
jgi:hypothetical protein